MSERGGPQPAPARTERPLWWWSMLHGIVVCAWGLFTILTPVSGPAGWVVDGIAFGVDLLIVGVILILQGRLARGPRQGTRPFVLGGVVMLATGIACIAVGVAGRPIAVMWTILGYLVVDGLILTLGTVRHPVYCFWGALAGVPMFVAAVGGVVLWALDPGFDVMDVVFGIFGIFYGICVGTASLLARSGELHGRPAV